MITSKDKESIKRKILVANIYIKPNSKKKEALLDHVAVTFTYYLAKYENKLDFSVVGDTNELSVDKLMQIDPALKQIVRSLMRGLKVLYPIIMNLGNSYQVTKVIAPLQNDKPRG